MDESLNENKAAGAPSELNVELDLLIEKFDSTLKIEIIFGEELTLDALNNKRNDLSAAIKRIKLADNILSEIHDKYTLMLERYSV